MEEKLKYTSKFNGEDTDSILEGAKKVINAELPSLDEIGGFMVYDKEGKAIGLMSSEQVSKVVGGLLPEASKTNKGLMTPYLAGLTVTHSVTVKSGDFVKLFTVRQFGIGTFQLFSGDFVANNPSTLYNAFITVNNRSQGNLNLVVMGVKATSATIYAKWNSDNSIDVYVKMPNAAYVICNLSWILQSTSYHFTTKMEIVNSVSETELTKYQL